MPSLHKPAELLAFESLLPTANHFFNSSPIIHARVPARLDIMGGIADYSGSNVAQATLQNGTLVALQSRPDQILRLRTQTPGNPIPQETQIPLASLNPSNSYDQIRALTHSPPLPAWSAYILGSLFALLKEHAIPLTNGFNILAVSSVPMNVGIASSAAIEVATLSALNIFLNLNLPPLRIAQLAQLAENKVVGAPCGIMDQIAIAAGQSGKLTHILCQPGSIIAQIPIPKNAAFAGLNSKLEHSVSGNPYKDVRIGAFIGKKIINTLRAKSALPRLSHLCELTPEQFHRDYFSQLPATISGNEFLDGYQSHEDPATTIDPDATYHISGPTRHPIEENHRVLNFLTALQNSDLIAAGNLMYDAHESYQTNCRLSAENVDYLVNLIRARGPNHGLYGAKITGAGTGGTLALLASPSALTAELPKILAQYQAKYALAPDLFQTTQMNNE